MASTAKKKTEKASQVVHANPPALCFDLLGRTDPYLDFGYYRAVFGRGKPDETVASAAKHLRDAFFYLHGTVKEPLLPLPQTLAQFHAFGLRTTCFLVECVRTRCDATFQEAWEATMDAIPEVSADYWYEHWTEEDAHHA